MSAFGERFLLASQETLRRDAAAIEGPPLVLPIGRERYRLEGLPPAAHRQLAGKYDALLDGETHSDPIVVRVRLAPSRHFKDIDPNLWLMEFDQQFYAGEVLLAGRNLFGRFQVDPGRAGEIWVADSEGALWEDLVGNCLRLLVAYSSLAQGGGLLHSAAVVVDGSARLFVGNQDSGKTHLARLALERGLTVLSDDLNVFQPAGGDRFELLKLPFAGELGRTTGETAESWPITSLHLLTETASGSESELESDSEPEPERVSLARAVASLAAASCFTNRDPHRHEALTDNLLRLARYRRPSWLDPTDRRALDRLLGC